MLQNGRYRRHGIRYAASMASLTFSTGGCTAVMPRVPRLRIGHPEELPVLRRGVPDRRDPADALLVGGADGHELVRVDEPPRDRPEFFAFGHHILENPASASFNERTTSAPSPTADATRFVDLLRAPPMAKTSCRVVTWSNGRPPVPTRWSVKLG